MATPDDARSRAAYRRRKLDLMQIDRIDLTTRDRDHLAIIVGPRRKLSVRDKPAVRFALQREIGRLLAEDAERVMAEAEQKKPHAVRFRAKTHGRIHQS